MVYVPLNFRSDIKTLGCGLLSCLTTKCSEKGMDLQTLDVQLVLNPLYIALEWLILLQVILV